MNYRLKILPRDRHRGGARFRDRHLLSQEPAVQLTAVKVATGQNGHLSAKNAERSLTIYAVRSTQTSRIGVVPLFTGTAKV